MQEYGKFIKLNQVLRHIPVSRSTWLRGVKKGWYPHPVKVSAKLTFWRTTDIQKLIDDLLCCEKINGKK
jgi:predicted DNA-binding transcriptional regulator AlpA